MVFEQAEQSRDIAFLGIVKYNDSYRGCLPSHFHSFRFFIIPFQNRLERMDEKMERQRRIYPGSYSRIASAVMLAAAVLVVISGLFSGERADGFSLSKMPQQTAVPLDEAFDETMTEAIVELPAKNWYALQVGVFESEESARQSSLAFQKRGAAGYLWQDGRYRVLAAAYPEREDAQQVREQLRDQHSIDSYLYAIEFPAVSMRLNGMQGQVDILQAAFAHVNDLALQIQALSVQMDRQELSASETAGQLSALDTQMDLVTLRLEQRFSAPVPSVVQALAECLKDYSQFVEDFSPQESAAALGMKLKYQLFVTLEHIQGVYQLLNHT